MKAKGIGGRILLLLGMAGLAILVILASAAYRRSLGPKLDTNIPTSYPTSQKMANPTSAPAADLATNTPSSPTSNPVTISTPTSITNQAAVCGERGAWKVLILGSDAADMRGPKGSDLARVARVDFTNQKVTIYAFPRDLWVTTTTVGFTNPVIDAARLGQVFYEARIRSTQTEDRNKMVDATNATARAMMENFSMHFDYYLTIDLLKLPAMIDTIGGVPIDVPERTTDEWIGMVIEAGPQTLNGNQVEAYARAIPDSDFARIQRNSLLLEALRQKLLDPSVWVKIPQLYEQVKEAMVTDLSPEQIIQLSCLMKNLPKESIIQDVVKPEWTTPGPQGSLLWDSTKVLARLKELQLIE